MIIREYESKDLRDVLNINKICHEKPQPNLGLLEQIHKGLVWVAVIDDKIVGFLLSIYREGPYIYNVAVLPEYRKQGIATALFTACDKYYYHEGCYFTYLYVNVNNPAQKLYFDLGYRVHEIKEDFYEPKQDALVMYRSIKSY